MFDETGKIIKMAKPLELKINKKYEGATQPKTIGGEFNKQSKPVEPSDYQTMLKKRRFFDSSLENIVNSKNKRNKPLLFSEQGSFIEMGNKMRRQQMAARLEQKQIERCEQQKSHYGPAVVEADRTAIYVNNVNSNDPTKQPVVPEIEWWDEFLLPETDETDAPRRF